METFEFCGDMTDFSRSGEDDFDRFLIANLPALDSAVGRGPLSLEEETSRLRMANRNLGVNLRRRKSSASGNRPKEEDCDQGWAEIGGVEEDGGDVRSETEGERRADQESRIGSGRDFLLTQCDVSGDEREDADESQETGKEEADDDDDGEEEGAGVESQHLQSLFTDLPLRPLCRRPPGPRLQVLSQRPEACGYSSEEYDSSFVTSDGTVSPVSTSPSPPPRKKRRIANRDNLASSSEDEN